MRAHTTPSFLVRLCLLVCRTAAVLAALAPPAQAQVVALSDAGVVVAHDGKLELHARSGSRRIWSVEGVRHAGSLAVGPDRVALLDPLHGIVRIADLSTGGSTVRRTGDTPIAALWEGGSLFVLMRDGRTLERISPDGSIVSIPTGIYPEFLRAGGGLLYVYSRGDGLFQQIRSRDLVVIRTARLAPYASDLEIDGRFAYLTYPSEARVRTIRLETLQPAGEVLVGSTPADLAVSRARTALTAGELVVADPASRRIWTVEGTQSAAAAFGRGFLRGFIGLGLFGGGAAGFGSGVDRVLAAGTVKLAYDSGSGRLYAFEKKRSRLVAAGLAPGAFAAAGEVVYYWNGTLVAEKALR